MDSTKVLEKKHVAQEAECGIKFRMRILLATLLLIAVLPAYGSMIVVTGVTLTSPPASVMAGQLLSNSTIYGFSEQQGVLLTSPLNVGITSPGAWMCCSGLPTGTIDAGVTVNSYLLRAAPETNGLGGYRDFQGEITFSPGEKIVGIIIGYKNIASTDVLFGAPGTLYPPASYRLGGLEPRDTVILGGNMETVYVNFHVVEGGMDMIRILTETPEPADFVLIGSGLIALALCRRRLRFGRATGR